MLKGIPSLLGPELLHALRAMGHGDDIAIVDGNFPSASNAKRLVRADGHSATELLRAVLHVMPIDDLRPDPIRVMEVTEDPTSVPPIVGEFERIAAEAERRALKARALPRAEFYAAARNAFVIVATGESRLYGNVLVTKGVVTQVISER
jgi:L-fucose mutarotase